MSAREWAVLTFSENEFEEVNLWLTREEARAFAAGCVYGAELYGGSGMSAYVYPDDDVTMRDEQRIGEILRALEQLDLARKLEAEIRR